MRKNSDTPATLVSTPQDGSRLLRDLVSFSIPYLIASFLQTFYGLADLFITSRYNGAASITGVTVGSQVTHMLTVMIVGLAMGTTVYISQNVGRGDTAAIARVIGSTVWIFAVMAVVLTGILFALCDPILSLLNTPAEAWSETRGYLRICFAGVPFIVAYNALSGIYRGLGDTLRPMYFVTAAGIVNIVLDLVLIGSLGMGAAGAAWGTILAQCFSVLLAVVVLLRRDYGVRMTRKALLFQHRTAIKLLSVGLPVAVQDGCIQIAFLTITAIANRRGLEVAAAVGIVEKLIGFFFLVPSAFGSATSVLAARCFGEGKPAAASHVLRDACGICVAFGAILVVLCNLLPTQIIGIFAGGDTRVITLGVQYLRTYIADAMIAGVHFCFSGYFCACEKAWISFAHNLSSVILFRVPGAYLASILFPDTLLPMGLAAPAGSLFSVAFCVVAYRLLQIRSTRRQNTPRQNRGVFRP